METQEPQTNVRNLTFRIGQQMKRILFALGTLEEEMPRKCGYNQTDIILRIGGFNPLNYPYYMRRLASATIGERLTQKTYRFEDRIAFATFSFKYPDSDLSDVKKYNDWIAKMQDGSIWQNRLYATYSRSITLLLKNGFIENTGVYSVRWFRSGYKLTEKGRNYHQKLNVYAFVESAAP